MPGLGNLFTRFAAKILDFDQTALPEHQFAIIQDMLASRTTVIEGNEAKDLLNCLKKKHLVNSITVRRFKTGLVFSSSGNGSQESKNASGILDFVNKSFASADVVTFRTEREWVMLLPVQNSLYIVKANSALSTIELKALAREIEQVLKKRSFS